MVRLVNARLPPDARHVLMHVASNSARSPLWLELARPNRRRRSFSTISIIVDDQLRSSASVPLSPAWAGLSLPPLALDFQISSLFSGLLYLRLMRSNPLWVF